MKARLTYTIVLGLLLAIVLVSFKFKTSTEPADTVLPDSIRELVEQEPVMNLRSAKMHLLDAKIIVGPAAGITGEKTDLYRSYEWLKEKGPDSLLLELVEAKNPYTRSYAFAALCKRSHPLLTVLFKKNMHDTTELKTLEGCLGGNCQLNHMWTIHFKQAVSDSVYWSIVKKGPGGSITTTSIYFSILE